MPNRILKESILSSDQINELSWFEEVLFYRLIVSADDYGCMDGRAAYLKSILFPLKEIRTPIVQCAINKLIKVGILSAEMVEGKTKLKFADWDKMQPNAGRATREYREWRKEVLKRDGFTCKMCGSKKSPLHVHHIKRYRSFIDERTNVSNGITLCEACHKKVHREEGR